MLGVIFPIIIPSGHSGGIETPTWFTCSYFAIAFVTALSVVAYKAKNRNVYEDDIMVAILALLIGAGWPIFAVIALLMQFGKMFK